TLCRSRNSYTSVSSTPGNVPGGTAASRWECARALGHESPAQRAASSAGGRRQHAGSGHWERARTVVSRPWNHLAWANGTPTSMAKSPALVRSTWVVHQYVPRPMSVYWWWVAYLSGLWNTARDAQ